MHQISSDRRKLTQITYATEKETRRALIEVFVFLFFVSVTTYVAINTQTIYSFYFNRTVERLFSQRVSMGSGSDVKFEDIATVLEFWDFLEHTFLESLVTNWESANESDDFSSRAMESRKASEANKMLFLGQNLILEAPRLRQIRIKSHSCYKHKAFEDLYKKCYGPYTVADELDEPEHLGSRYFHLERSSVLPFWGNLERYRGAGYVQFLTYDQSENERIIRELKDKEWIDRASRLVMIEMVAYNNNMDLFNNMRFVAEIMPIGSIVSYSHMEVAPLFSQWSIQAPAMLAANIIFYAFIIFNTGNEISEIYECGLKTYLSSVWNYIDWGILITAYFSLVLSILHSFFIDEYLEDVFSHRYEKLSSIDKTCHWFAIYVASMACLAFLVWIRIFRFIGFNKTMLAFYLALKQCASDILGFAIIIFIVFMAFALLGLVLFGESDLDFSTFQYAYFFMMRLMLHDFEYTNFERSDPFWGQLYFICFIVVVIFLCFNMFLAIISQTYINVKREKIETTSSIKAVFEKFHLKFRECFAFINKKLSPKPRSTPQASAHSLTSSLAPENKPTEKRVKTIQFLDGDDDEDSIGVPTISSAGTRDSRISPKTLNEDEALKEFYGIKRSSDSSTPIKRSISQYSVSTFATPESSIGIGGDKIEGESLEEEEDADEGADEDADKDVGKNETDTSDTQSDKLEDFADNVDPLIEPRDRLNRLQADVDDLAKDMKTILNRLIEMEKLKKGSHQ